jgi:hypothetical protein
VPSAGGFPRELGASLNEALQGCGCRRSPDQRHLAFDKISLVAPWIEVDTTSGYRPGIDQVVAFVNGS